MVRVNRAITRVWPCSVVLDNRAALARFRKVVSRIEIKRYHGAEAERAAASASVPRRRGRYSRSDCYQSKARRLRHLDGSAMHSMNPLSRVARFDNEGERRQGFRAFYFGSAQASTNPFAFISTCSLLSAYDAKAGPVTIRESSHRRSSPSPAGAHESAEPLEPSRGR